jgi:hypothetical protein
VTINERIEAGRRGRRVLARDSRAAGWPAPEHPGCGEDTGLDGRDLIADRPDDEVSWLRAGSPSSTPGPGELTIAAVPPGRRAERRRRLAEPDLDFRTFCRAKRMPSSTPPQMERAWDAWQAERYRRGETGQQPAYTGYPFRGR